MEPSNPIRLPDDRDAAAPQPAVRVLLVEDDDADATLVSDETETTGAAVTLPRARTLSEPYALVRGVVERAEELDGGPLLDDVALLLVHRTGA
jgi:hypothetical protein